MFQAFNNFRKTAPVILTTFCVVPSIHSAVTLDYCSPYELAPTFKIQMCSCQFQQDFLVLSAVAKDDGWMMDGFLPQKVVFVCGRRWKRKKRMEMRRKKEEKEESRKK